MPQRTPLTDFLNLDFGRKWDQEQLNSMAVFARLQVGYLFQLSHQALRTGFRHEIRQIGYEVGRLDWFTEDLQDGTAQTFGNFFYSNHQVWSAQVERAVRDYEPFVQEAILHPNERGLGLLRGTRELINRDSLLRQVASAIRGSQLAIPSDWELPRELPRTLPEDCPPRSVIVGCEPVVKADQAVLYKDLAADQYKQQRFPDKEGLRAAAKTLESEFPWLKRVNATVTQHLLRVSEYGHKRPKKLPTWIMTGPPGTGKTTYWRRLCELIDLPIGLKASGASDPHGKLLGGIAKSWSAGHPGEIIQAFRRTKSFHFAAIIDDIHAAESLASVNGSLYSVLLPFTDTAYQHETPDPYSGALLDLTGVSWLMTTNEVHSLNPALVSRSEVLWADRPGPEHTQVILRRIIDEIQADWNLTASSAPPIHDQLYDWVENKLRNGSVPRTLRRELETLYLPVDQREPPTTENKVVPFSREPHISVLRDSSVNPGGQRIES